MRRALLLALVAAPGAAWAAPVINAAVPQPAKPVVAERYMGRYYEVARVDSLAEHDCEAATIEYAPGPGGSVLATNTCRQGSPTGPAKAVRARATILDGSRGAKFRMSLGGVINAGEFWILDRADDYGWAIVGQSNGRYLWLLSRTVPTNATRAALLARARALGYDVSGLHITKH